jgi:hypothetical protein
MKLLLSIFNVIRNAYSFSTDPNLFGSRKRRKGKTAIANEFKTMAGETQGDIDILKAQNPWETAAAKSAMAKTKRNVEQMQTRMFNTMGTGATPEAIIAGQGAATEALGATAGEIAVGAEARKAAELAQLRGEKMGEMSQYAGIKSSAEDERGSGWNTLFQGIDALGSLATGVGGAGGAVKTARGN